jgi:uncharacterized membrane protein
VSTYRNLIDLTIETITKRARYYRNLVVAVVIAGLGSFVAAIIAKSWFPLTVLLLFFPVCGIYFFFDGRQLQVWRSSIFSQWVKGEAELCYFHDAVSAVPTLPKFTLQSMLETLPSLGDILTEQSLTLQIREAVADTVNCLHSGRSAVIVLKTVGWSISGCSLAIAITQKAWQPLVGVAVVGVLLVLWPWLKLYFLKRLLSKLDTSRHESNFDTDTYVMIVGSLEWSPFSEADKDRYLAELNLGSKACG